MEYAERPVLSIQHVSKKFGGVQAVCDVSLNVAPGERRLFIGTNGAGKTTLFNLIAGDLKVSAGTIELFGQDVTNMPVHKRVRLGMRRTYQTSALFNGLTVLENLYLALMGDSRVIKQINFFSSFKKDLRKMKQAEDTAKTIGLHQKINVSVKSLSHGERRQLEFGLAIITKPKLLLFDEPAAGLSADERHVMLKLIQRLEREITVILIEHDMDIAFAVADFITVMYEGKVIANGTTEEIKNNRLVQDIYLGGNVHDNAHIEN